MFSSPSTRPAMGGAKLLGPDQIPLTSTPRQDLLSESLLPPHPIYRELKSHL